MVMPNESIPPSSVELKRWLTHLRESRSVVQRGLKGVDEAIKRIEEISVKAPRTSTEQDGPETR